MFIDQNVTGLITANVNLSQSYWAFLFNLLGGALSAAIGAYAVYRTTERTQKYDKSLIEEKESREKLKTLREERKKAYINFIHVILLFSTGQNFDMKILANALTEIKLIGSPEVIVIMDALFSDAAAINKAYPNSDNMKQELVKTLMIKWSELLMPLMAKELQGEDVYKLISQQKLCK